MGFYTITTFFRRTQFKFFSAVYYEVKMKIDSQREIEKERERQYERERRQRRDTWCKKEEKRQL